MAGTGFRSYASVERDDLQVGLAILVAASGVIHLAVTPAHFDEYLPFGVFFLVCGALQLLLAHRCLRRGSRSVVRMAGALSLLIAVVWLGSRTTGLPIGPEAGEAERIGLSDVVATLYELAAVGFAAVLAGRLPGRERVRARATTLTSTAGAVLGWMTVGAIFVGH